VAVKNAILHGVAKPHSLAGGWTLTNGRLNAAKALSAPASNATPVTDGSIAGAIALVHVRKGSLSYPADVNDVFKARLRKGHRYVVRLVVPPGANFDVYLWAPGTVDVWPIDPSCGKPCRLVSGSARRAKGKDEAFAFTAGRAGSFHLVVTDVSGRGKYTLTMSSPTKH
jgi:hypothetical protein